MIANIIVFMERILGKNTILVIYNGKIVRKLHASDIYCWVQLLTKKQYVELRREYLSWKYGEYEL